MPKVFKLSPSDLTFLWDECKRCFYLKVVEGFTRPWAPFPKIFNRIDQLMKDFFEGKPTSELSNDLDPGSIKFSDKWVTSVEIQLPGHEDRCYIKGKIDTGLAFEDGTFGVIDFKTSEPGPGHVPFYSRQLHAYAYALEHPKGNSFALSPITTLGLFVVEPTAIFRQEDGRIGYLGEPTWMDVPIDEGQFLAFLGEVMTLLESPSPPEAASECGHCIYHASATQYDG